MDGYLWLFTETCEYKKYFKLQSTSGATFIWFLTTSGSTATCYGTTAGGPSGGVFMSTFSISVTCAPMLCKNGNKLR